MGNPAAEKEALERFEKNLKNTLKEDGYMSKDGKPISKQVLSSKK